MKKTEIVDIEAEHNPFDRNSPAFFSDYLATSAEVEEFLRLNKGEIAKRRYNGKWPLNVCKVGERGIRHRVGDVLDYFVPLSNQAA